MARWVGRRRKRKLKEYYQEIGRKAAAATNAKAPPGFHKAMQLRSVEARKAKWIAEGRPPAEYIQPRVRLYREHWRKLLWIKEHDGLNPHRVLREALMAWLVAYEKKRGAPIPVEEPGSAGGQGS